MTITSGKRARMQIGLAAVASLAAIAAPAAFAGNGYQASKVDMTLGSPDPRDTAHLSGQRAHFASSVVARSLGSPDARDAGLQSDGDFMFRDYFRGTHWTE
jgi:hypothetical protein